MNLARLKQAEAYRQAALDHIRENPGAIGPDIIKALGWTIAAGSSRLEHMTCQMGELSRESVEVTRKTVHGFMHKQSTYAYTALAVTTRTAEDVLADIRAGGRKGGSNSKPQTRRKNVGEWTARGYLNIKEDREPIKNQEAIGSGRNRVFAGTSCNMI